MDPTQAREAERLRRRLWGVAYRMTGTVQDADEVVQDCFLRLLERPPADTGRPLDGWMVTVALNLSRDRLRRRQREAYLGPWLPAPVPDERLADEALMMRETASWAFLRAAEALSPTQRAVFLAREVLELSAAETAAALDSSPGAVDVALHEARARLGKAPKRPRKRDDAVVLAFLGALQLGLTGAATRLLHPNAVALNDGGGVVQAARVPVRGAGKIVTFFRRLQRQYPAGVRWRLRRCNGALTVVGEHRDPRLRGRKPNRFTLICEVEGGQICTLWSQLVPAKLAHL